MWEPAWLRESAGPKAFRHSKVPPTLLLIAFHRAKRLQNCGLLLGQTVECAEAPDQFLTINDDHSPLRKMFEQNTKRDVVVRLAIGCCYHNLVADVKVGVDRRQ